MKNCVRATEGTNDFASLYNILLLLAFRWENTIFFLNDKNFYCIYKINEIFYLIFEYPCTQSTF